MNAFFSARYAVLGLLAAAAIAVCALFPHALPFRASLSVFVIAAALSFVHLRHVGLAPIVAVAPLPGILIAHASGAATPLMIALAYLPGFACASFMADDIAARIAGGMERRAAVDDAVTGSALSAGLAILAAAFALAACWMLFRAPVALASAASVFAAGISAILVVPLAASALPFSEEFVTRANRLREWRERIFDLAASVAEPRWAVSVAGIAIIFAVLGVFGMHIAPGAQQSALLAALPLAAAIAAFALTREWRASIAVAGVLAIVVLIGLWGAAQLHVRFSPRSLLLMLETLGMCAVATILMAVESERHLSEDASAAMSIAILRKGPWLFFLFVAAVLAAIAQFEGMRFTAVLAVMTIFGGVGALLALPAVAIALGSLFPRRSTLEARYRVR